MTFPFLTDSVSTTLDGNGIADGGNVIAASFRDLRLWPKKEILSLQTLNTHFNLAIKMPE